jgi:hypothetical protein
MIGEELDEAIVEFGLETIVLAEEFEFTYNVDTERVYSKTGRSNLATTSQSYEATFRTRDRIERESLYREDGAPEPRTITITGIKTPEIVKLEEALVVSSHYDTEIQEIEITAMTAEVDKLW